MIKSLLKLSKEKKIQAISTGLYAVDMAIGTKGFPRGSIAEIHGESNTCKSAFVLNTMKKAIDNGLSAVYMDLDCSFDPLFASLIGIKFSDFIISQPPNADIAFDIIKSLINSNEVDLIVVDSIASLVPEYEINRSMEQNTHNIYIQNKLKELATLIKPTKTVLLLTNQLKRNYNSPIREKTLLDSLLEMQSSTRLRITKNGNINNGIYNIGENYNVKLTRSSFVPMAKLSSFTLLYNNGISNILDIINVAQDLNIITNSGGWYKYDNKKIHGLQPLKNELFNNQILLGEIEDKIKEELYGKEESKEFNF